MPLGSLIESEGLALEFDFSETEWFKYGTPEDLQQERDTVLKNLEGKSQAERDALLLGRLSFTTMGTIPMLSLTALKGANLFDVYLDVLDRHQMDDHAAAMRRAKAGYPVWNTSVNDRYYQWSDGKGTIRNPVLDATLREES